MTTPTTTQRDTGHLSHRPSSSAAAPSSLQDQARERIEGMIADGSLPAGSRLPPFRELARQLGTSVTPLQRAVRELAAAGIVEVRHGSGVRVLGQRPPASPCGEAATRSSGTLVVVGVISRLGPRYDANRWKQRIVSALERELTMLGHGVLFFSQLAPGDDGALLPLEDVLAEALEGAGCGAVALVEPGGGPAALEPIGDRLAVLERPGVWVSGHAHRAPVNSVYYDNDWAGYAAARHLAEHGHREIAAAVLDPAEWGDSLRAGGAQGWAAERLEGVRRACRQFGLRLTPLPVRRAVLGGDLNTPGFWSRCGAFIADAVLAFPAASGPTALVALNDECAVAAMDRLAAAGRVVPGDLSVVGFDNAEEGRLRRLTTVEPPIEELGHEAARALHRACASGTAADPSAPVQHLLVKPSLIARASVAAPPKGRGASAPEVLVYSGASGA